MSPTPDQASKEAGSLPRKIEAVLFAAGRKVALQELCDLCSVKEGGLVKEAIKELRSNLDSRGSSILLTEEADGWKFTVKEAYLPLVQSIVPHMELDHALLETLAVIAWKQPVFQSEVVRIRTTAAYEHVKMLEEMGFVSKEKHGSTFILKATGKFFDYFDLPNKEAVREMFKNIEANYEKALKEKAQEGQAALGAGHDASSEEKHEHLGKLDVYDTADAAPEEKLVDSYDQQRLGRLDVVDVGAGPGEDKEEGEEAEGSDAASESVDDDGKMKEIVEGLTGETLHGGDTALPGERRKLHAVLEDMASQPLDSVEEADGKGKKPSLVSSILPRTPALQQEQEEKEHEDEEEDDEENTKESDEENS